MTHCHLAHQDIQKAETERKSEFFILSIKTKFNQVVQNAHQRRLDLIIHRECIGFRLKNKEIIEAAFPIPPPYQV
jgi:hypothetical protein